MAAGTTGSVNEWVGFRSRCAGSSNCIPQNYYALFTDLGNQSEGFYFDGRAMAGSQTSLSIVTVLELAVSSYFHPYSNGARPIFECARSCPAETWVPEYQNLKIEKAKNLSLIASRQNQLEGHKLRHELVEMLRVSGADVDILGRGYQPFEEKADGLAPYRFSIITENVRNHSYFTEKIVDALLCETVPIYWGAPNIDRFFDPRGMIACKNAAEMFDAAGRADEKLYQEMKPALLHAKEQAIAHSNYKHAAALIIQNEL